MRGLMWLSGPPVLLLAALALLGAGNVENANPHGDLNVPCSDCHGTESWLPLLEPLPFRHGSVGRPLTGAHAGTDCRSCHQSLVFAFVGTACQDCHQDAHGGELGVDCETCHDTNSWESQQRALDAHDRSLFPLFASHTGLDCASCHEGQRPFEYVTTPTECSGCHLGTFRETANPDHVQAGFGTDCLSCHRRSSMAWDQAVFLHPPTFPLRGAHAAISCETCHANGFSSLPRECVACHRQDFQSATNPNHAAGGFSTECQICHTENGWIPATFRHELTAFPLRGAHGGLDCSACHARGYAGTPTDCYACHRADYQGTTDPNHPAAGFPTTCEGCHSETAWRPAAGFDHNTSRFPLRGAHVALDCSACHSQGFAGTPTDCYACHSNDYQGTTDPNHAAAGFPTSCEACHSQNAWTPATNIDHNQTAFPLTGAHRSLDCSACHSQGFAGTPTDCYACHADDYRRASDPNHNAAGFPTTCENCHNTSRWDQSSWNHNIYFPIYSGSHRGVWTSCSECHINPSSFAVFSCIDCHEHSRARTDSEHRGVGGYQYESNACYACHPTGRE